MLNITSLSLLPKIDQILEKRQNKMNERNKNEKDKENLNKSNWDNYFSQEELEYYDKLYETENFDRPEIKKVTNYKKGELIGEGAYGKVFRAFDETHGRLIAIKEVEIKEFSKEINVTYNKIKKIRKLIQSNQRLIYYQS